MARINPPHRYFGRFEQRENILECVGDAVPPHTHPVDHLTYIIRGAVRVRLERGDDVKEAVGQPGDIFFVPAGVLHSLVAEADDSRADCLFADSATSGGC